MACPRPLTDLNGFILSLMNCLKIVKPYALLSLRNNSHINDNWVGEGRADVSATDYSLFCGLCSEGFPLPLVPRIGYVN